MPIYNPAAAINKLDDIADVDVPSPTDGYVVYWDAATSLWKCKLISATKLIDADADTKVDVEESADEDKIRMDVKGIEAFLLSDAGRLTLAKQSYFMARRTTAQSIPQATWTKIQFNTEDVDIQGEYDSVTNFRFTAVEAGIYIVFISAGLYAPADGTRVILDAYKNGAACLRLCDIQVGGATAFSPGGASGFINLAATDYIEAFIYQSGVAKDIAASDSANRFGVVKIA